MELDSTFPFSYESYSRRIYSTAHSRSKFIQIQFNSSSVKKTEASDKIWRVIKLFAVFFTDKPIRYKKPCTTHYQHNQLLASRQKRVKPGALKTIDDQRNNIIEQPY